MKGLSFEKNHIVAVIAIIGILLIAVMMVVSANSNETLPVDTGNTSVQEPAIDIIGPIRVDVSSYVEVTAEANGLASVEITNNGKSILKTDTTNGKMNFNVPLEFGLNDVVVTCYDKSGKVINTEETLVAIK